ncbi:MAG: diadenosine tetraphosphate hydrolase [Gammaproteobacteria bacterium HGW-Gammaproteobacteria-8]|nr:MAG: diadenosine tetraphosphate hydrolase [Gammaproteobacteria bacterium HGW-Gammaproteobacteria-8]
MTTDATNFELDPRLAADTLPLARLALCDLRLMNDQRYPWLVLVPRRPGAVEWIDLAEADQQTLWAEVRQAAVALRTMTKPDKLNVAALGNQVRQLHVHLIARSQDDDAWPDPVWGRYPALPYNAGGDAFREELLALMPEPGR